MSNVKDAAVALIHGKRTWALATLAGVISLVFPVVAQAQEQTAPVSAKGKGITGGALLGAETALITEALLGVKPAWAYLVGGAGGAGVGGFGGYYAERADSAKLSLYLLAGGMALAIPTTVAVLSATAYEPPAEYTEDQGPEVEQPDTKPPLSKQDEIELGMRGRRLPAHRSRSKRAGKGNEYLHIHRRFRVPPLVGVTAGQLCLNVPALQLREVFSRRELFEYGLDQATEVRLQLFGAEF